MLYILRKRPVQTMYTQIKLLLQSLHYLLLNQPYQMDDKIFEVK